MTFDLNAFVIYPLLIFFARILDVPIGTIRIIFLAKGKRFWVPILGFVEILIWLLVITKIVHNVDKPQYYIAYALGFATGSWIGILIDQKLALGTNLIRIITAKPAEELISTLRGQGYSITDVPAEGRDGRVNVIFTVVQRKEVDNVIKNIKQYNPQAFYTIEEIGYASKNTIVDREKRYKRFMLMPRK